MESVSPQAVFAVHNYQQGVQRLCAACDEDLLGQQFQEGKFRLDTSTGFYDDLRVDDDALRQMLSMCTMANLVGPKTIAIAIDMGLVEEANVIQVQGVPHAQMVVMLP